MTTYRHRHKTYWQFGPLEIQYGHLSQSLAVFWRSPWRRLVVLPLGPTARKDGMSMLLFLTLCCAVVADVLFVVRRRLARANEHAAVLRHIRAYLV